MGKLFTKENMARLLPDERFLIMQLQMSPAYGGNPGGYLPDDCGECGACGVPMLGSGWCGECANMFEKLRVKALG